MRTAEEIIQQSIFGSELFNSLNYEDGLIVIHLINTARKEAIYVCANQIISNNPVSAKERIISLIDELK